MSHFSLAVITSEKPTDQELERLLQPYHEFECTGYDDQYIVDVDETEERRKDYEKGERTFYQGPHGDLFDSHDDRFYRDPTPEEIKEHGPMMGMGWGGGIHWYSKDWGDGKGYRAKVHFLPKDYTEVKKPLPEVESFEDWVQEYYEYPLIDPNGVTIKGGDNENGTKYGYISLSKDGTVKVINRTNPNSKWDWWQVGGRWSNHYGKFDQVKIGDIDLTELLFEHRKEAASLWDRAHAVMGDNKVPLWKGGLMDQAQEGLITWDEARNLYNGNPTIKALRALGDDFFWLDLQDFNKERAEYISDYAVRRVSCFAYLLDGKWNEKGQMLMFAAVQDAKDDDVWARHFLSVIRDHPEHWITVVDCHI